MAGLFFKTAALAGVEVFYHEAKSVATNHQNKEKQFCETDHLLAACSYNPGQPGRFQFHRICTGR